MGKLDMAGGFGKNCSLKFSQHPVPVQSLDRELVTGVEAGFQLAVCCQTNAVAAGTEVVAQGTDKTNVLCARAQPRIGTVLHTKQRAGR